jgi:uncharacterized protein (DUF2252 family)
MAVTPAERVALGKTARAQAPRSSHGDWEPAADRADPVAILEQQALSRVPELVPLRYSRMLASAFAFFRGGAAIMAADLAPTPQSGIRVQLCGDAHLSNFGAFAAPDRDLVFDVNDFDETLPGPWEWDLKRLVASIEIAARERGFDRAERDRVVLASVREYRQTMRRLAELTNLDLWYLRLDLSATLERWGSADAAREQRKAFDRSIAKGRAKDRMRAFSKLTCRVDGELRIVSDPPIIVPVEELASAEQIEHGAERLKAILHTYRASLGAAQRRLFESYRYVDTARKVVGVGSVGTRTWIALFVGRDEDDPLFLQVKEAQESVLEPFAGQSEFGHRGERVVEGQRLTQAAGDILLGWTSAKGLDDVERAYYVRQLWDQKTTAPVETMSPRRLDTYAQMCGSTLARAHARSGDRIAIAAYLGASDTFDLALARFATAYADQNERDYAGFKETIAAGRISAG